MEVDRETLFGGLGEGVMPKGSEIMNQTLIILDNGVFVRRTQVAIITAHVEDYNPPGGGGYKGGARIRIVKDRYVKTILERVNPEEVDFDNELVVSVSQLDDFDIVKRC